MLKDKTWIYLIIFNIILFIFTSNEVSQNYYVDGHMFGYEIRIEGDKFLNIMNDIYKDIPQGEKYDIFTKCYNELKNMLANKSFFITKKQQDKFQLYATRMIVIYYEVVGKYPFNKIKNEEE